MISFSGITIVRDVGIYASVGVIIGSILAVVFIPAFLRAGRKRFRARVRPNPTVEGFLNRHAYQVLRHRRVVLGGALIDRIRTPKMHYALAASFLLQCAGVTLFLFNQESMAALYAFFILYGVGMGAVMPMTPVLRARYFGRKSFGTIAGWSRALTIPVGVIGPVLAGWIFDVTGSYEIAFVLFAVTLGISAVIMIFARPPKPLQRHPSP